MCMIYRQFTVMYSCTGHIIQVCWNQRRFLVILGCKAINITVYYIFARTEVGGPVNTTPVSHKRSYQTCTTFIGARQHTCRSRYKLSPVRRSVCPSHACISQNGLSSDYEIYTVHCELIARSPSSVYLCKFTDRIGVFNSVRKLWLLGSCLRQKSSVVSQQCYFSRCFAAHVIDTRQSVLLAHIVLTIFRLIVRT